MSFNTQLQVGNLGYLDVSNEVLIPLTLAVAPIQDISKKTGSFSKTIRIPGTANNNKLLGQLFDVNIADATFNQNLRASAIIIQKGVPLFAGYLQLLDVIKMTAGQGGVDELVKYDVALKDDTADFFSSLDKGYLSDFDYNQYNHTYTLTAVTATSAHTWADAYKYHMFYNQKPYYEISDFKPGIFALHYWNNIFSAAGYTYEWNNNYSDTKFEKMIIPFNGDKDLNDVSDLTFRAGFSAITRMQSINYWADPRNSDPHPPQSSYIYLNAFQYKFNDDVTDILNDNNNLYNRSGGTYTANFYGQNTIKMKVNYTIYYSANTTLTLTNDSTSISPPKIIIGAHHTFTKTSSFVPTQTQQLPDFAGFNVAVGGVLTSGLTAIYSGTSTADVATFNVLYGDVIREYMSTRENYYGCTYRNGGGAIVWPTLIVEIGINPTDYANNYLLDEPSTLLLGEQREVFVGSFVPKKIKWKDYVSSVCKLFNLYLTPSKDKDKHIIVQTRDEFYDSGVSLDWTHKVDRAQDIRIQFLPDLQNKKLQLSYKQGSDLWNTNYFSNLSEVFGQTEYTFENEFQQGIKKIEPMFEPTPLVHTLSGGGNNIVSAIDSKTTKTGLKILYDGGWISGGSWTYHSFHGITTATTTFDGTAIGYPYAGHLYPEPISPTETLEYSLSDYYFYNDWTYLSDNGLYNRYYRRLVSQIETGKMMTCYMHLDEYDILNLDFRNKIFIDDTYWFVNKIIDYNANTNKLTQVELINVDEGIKFEPFQRATKKRPPYTDWTHLSLGAVSLATGLDNIIGGGTVGVSVLGSGNIISAGAPRSMTTGNDNEISSEGSFTLGDNNVVNGVAGESTPEDIVSNKSVVIGNSNTIQEVGSFVNGDNNFIDPGFRNVTLFGNNNTGATTGVFVIGNSISATTPGLYVSNITMTGNINGMPFSAVTGSSSNYYTTAATYNVGTQKAFFNRNDMLSAYSLDLSAIIAGSGTLVQGGFNTYTGGTSSFPTVNISAATLNYMNAASVSATTYMSGASTLAAVIASLAGSGTSGNLWSGSTGPYSIIANNGSGNLAAGDYSTVMGQNNRISAGSYYSTIAGGAVNTISDFAAFIGTGVRNGALGKYSTAIAGRQNSATTTYASVLNGRLNTASGVHSAIIAGKSHIASGLYSSVFAGQQNAASANYSSVFAGGKNVASGTISMVGSGSGNTASAFYTLITQGKDNTVSASISSIFNGSGNTVSAAYATIVNGWSNTANGLGSFIANGAVNLIDTSALFSAIMGGTGHTIYPGVSRSVILGGKDIIAQANDTVYVPYLKIQSVTASVPTMMLGLDASGNVVTASTSSGDVTRVQPGTNTYTGGTDNFPTVNISAATLTYLSATTISATTYYSGNTTLAAAISNLVGTGSTSTVANSTLPLNLGVAASDETTVLTSGNAKLTFLVPRTGTLTKIVAALNTTGSTTTTVRVNKNGTVVSSGNIDLASGVGSNSITTPTLTATTFNAWDTYSIDIVSAGTAAKGLKVYFEGTYANPFTASTTTIPFEIGMAITDETTQIVTGATNMSMLVPFTCTVTGATISLTTTASTLTTVNVKLTGTTIFSTKATIDANEYSSQTAATPPVITGSTFTQYDQLVFAIDGAGTGAKGLKIWLTGTRTI